MATALFRSVTPIASFRRFGPKTPRTLGGRSPLPYNANDANQHSLFLSADHRSPITDYRLPITAQLSPSSRLGLLVFPGDRSLATTLFLPFAEKGSTHPCER